MAAEKMQKNDKARLADLNKRIIRMEKIIALQADASRFKKAKEEELKRREAEKKAAEEKLAAERKAAEENLAKMKIQQTAQAALAKAASKIQAAEALDANKHDSKNLDAAKIGLQKARYDFEQGKFQDVPASAEVAYKKAEEAIATAQAKFAEENKKIALLKERESLFKEATIIQGVNARQEARGVVFTLYDMFPSNKTTVVPEQAYLLDKIAKLTKKYPGYPILVEAYTDSRGREVDNLALSQGRAQSVLAYFVEQHKLGFNRIRSSGYGEANPVADNSNSAGRAKNRRVEMIFLFR
ncbi:MAG: OmpA family protein [Deltaproteobacteria bacterium]|nr:OmpA family protein [Deltaproteobacteria bacterium]